MNIKNSCCDESEVEWLFKKFNLSIIPTITLRYQAVIKMLNYLVSNYENLVGYAYDIFRLPKKAENCE